MAEALVDANIIVGYALKRDQFHEQGREIVRAMDHGDLPLGQVTNYVLPEILHPVAKTAGHQTSLDLLDRITQSGGFRIVHLAHEDFTRAQALYRRENGVNFVDAITVAYMQRQDLEYIYTFDDDFDRFDDITRLTSVSNPFEPE